MNGLEPIAYRWSLAFSHLRARGLESQKREALLDSKGMSPTMRLISCAVSGLLAVKAMRRWQLAVIASSRL